MPVTGAWSEDDEERMAIVMADLAQPEDFATISIPKSAAQALFEALKGVV
jgi:hypothetical protein